MCKLLILFALNLSDLGRIFADRRGQQARRTDAGARIPKKYYTTDVNRDYGMNSAFVKRGGGRLAERR